MDKTDGLVFKILGVPSTSRKEFLFRQVSVSHMRKMYRNHFRILIFDHIFCLT